MISEPPLPIELYLEDRPGTPRQVEVACALAVAHPYAVAVAVAPAHVSRAANLVYGTGVAVVSVLAGDASDLFGQARLSAATGATEIALPAEALDDVAILERLASVLGTTTPLTVNITTPDGNVSLDRAEHALVLGTSYVAYAPEMAVIAPRQIADLVALASELQLGGVKVVGPGVHHRRVLPEHEWTLNPGDLRLCVPASSVPDADVPVSSIEGAGVPGSTSDT